MKRCPGCSRNYMEDGLSFCLECGTPLLDAGTVSGTTPGDTPGFDPNATLAFAPPHDTSPPPTQIIDASQLPQFPPSSQSNQPSQPSWQQPPPAYNSSPGQQTAQHQSTPPPAPPSQHHSVPPPTSFVPQAQARQSDPGRFSPSTNPPQNPPLNATPPAPNAWNQPQQQSASGAPNYGYAATTPSDKPKSKLPLILGVVALLGVLGIGGIIALVMLGGDDKPVTNNANNRVANNNVKTPPANTNVVKPDVNAKTYRDDFSNENWETGADAFGSYYKDGEYVMKRTDPGTFIVMYGGRGGNRASFNTPNSTVKVTTRSVDGNVPQFGYGLVVQGELIEQGKDKFLNDYAFLIRNGSAGEYSIVKHVRTTQTDLVTWTKSATIRTGTTPNELEVRIDGNDLTFYINGQRIRSINDTTYASGYAGFYTSTGGAVAFDNLEITRK